MVEGYVAAALIEDDGAETHLAVDPDAATLLDWKGVGDGKRVQRG